MPVDLLGVGESFAELDIVVRQLEDGSLTLATDDAVPDDDRLRVTATPVGLVASRKVGQVAFNPGLCRGLDALNRQVVLGRWVWRTGAVRVEALLPFADRSLAPNQLRLAFGLLDGAARKHGAQLLEVARGQADWTTLLADGLPPSYLPGSGQKGVDERTTQRYGGVGAVPGRGELTHSEARRQSDRAAKVSRPERPQVVTARPRGSGVLGLLLVLTATALGAAGWALHRRQAEHIDTPPAPPPPPQTEPPPGPDPDVPATPDPGEPVPSPDPRPGTTPSPRPAPFTTPSNEAEVLQQLKAHPEHAQRLLEVWVDRGWDKREGARRRVMEALPKDDLSPDVVRVVLKSVRDHPLDAFEAMDCWPYAPSSVRRHLIQALGTARDGRQDVVAFLAAHLTEDTPDRLMQESLLVLGQPRPETISALLQARGPEWALLGDGRALIESAVKADLQQVEPLAKHGDEEVRGFACGLLGAQSGRPRDALKLLSPLLADASERVQTRAIEACVQLGEGDASWPLARALQRSSSTPGPVRDALRDAFRRLPAKTTVPLLTRMYAKEQPQERLAAVLAFEACEAKEGVPGLIKALGDADREVRLTALNALSGYQKSKPALRPAVMEGLAAIRALALDKSDRELSRLAGQLHLQISGRMPDAR